MCFSGCFWEDAAGECRKPRHEECPDDLSADEVEALEATRDTEWAAFLAWKNASREVRHAEFF